MTVKDLKKELEFYDDDKEIVFEVCGDFEPDSITEDKWGNREVHLNVMVKPVIIFNIHGKIRIELRKDDE